MYWQLFATYSTVILGDFGGGGLQCTVHAIPIMMTGMVRIKKAVLGAGKY